MAYLLTHVGETSSVEYLKYCVQRTEVPRGTNTMLRKQQCLHPKDLLFLLLAAVKT